MNSSVIHLAGFPLLPSGEQRCILCGAVITEPGLTPFRSGSVEVLTYKGMKATTPSQKPPTCTPQP